MWNPNSHHLADAQVTMAATSVLIIALLVPIGRRQVNFRKHAGHVQSTCSDHHESAPNHHAKVDMKILKLPYGKSTSP